MVYTNRESQRGQPQHPVELAPMTKETMNKIIRVVRELHLRGYPVTAVLYTYPLGWRMEVSTRDNANATTERTVYRCGCAGLSPGCVPLPCAVVVWPALARLFAL